MVMTVGSVVFRPEDGAFWVGTGETPTSHGAFAPFSLRTESSAPELGELVVGAATSADRDRVAEAFEHYRRAYVSYLEQEDRASARVHIARACESDPMQAVYCFVRGIYALEDLELSTADEALSRAIELGHPDAERVAGFHLWRARARDLLGRRSEALTDYRRSLGHHADRPVHEAARRGLRRAFTRDRVRRVHVDMSLGDVISP
jgi:tetratricopeptide (TPR) repeat protein